MNVIRWS